MNHVLKGIIPVRSSSSGGKSETGAGTETGYDSDTMGSSVRGLKGGTSHI